ncbi:MAG: HAMP domain-containing sensor histidine kinase, partial [Niameybacter sp.]
LIMSFVIGAFTFGFLNTTAYALAEKAVTKGYSELNVVLEPKVVLMIEEICFIGAAVVFIVIFLYLVGQKLIYILEINEAIQKIEKGDFTYRVEVVGENELTEVACSLNNLAQMLENYIANEEQLKSERMELIQSLSHDIRTPLTAIISYTEFIKDKKYESEEKLEGYTSIIQSKAYQIKELTQMLFDYNKEAVAKVEGETLDGKVLVEQLLQEYQDILEEEDFQVEIDLKELVDFETSLNPQDMVRIFDNLVSNIIKYATPTQAIVFKVSLLDHTLSLVQMNKTDAGGKKEVESYGIGVKNIKQLAKKYKGTVELLGGEGVYQIEIKLSI